MAAGISTIDTEKYRRRRFVEQLIELGELEVHDEPVPLVGLSPIIEGTADACPSATQPSQRSTLYGESLPPGLLFGSGQDAER